MKLFWTITLGLIGLIGLGMSLCGGIFTASALLSMMTPRRGEDYAIAALVFSVPSLLAGGGILWLVRRRVKQLRALP